MQSVSEFSLAYFVIYFYICVQEHFSVSWKSFNGMENLCITICLEYLPPTRFEPTL